MLREAYIKTDGDGRAIHKGYCRRGAPACWVGSVAQLAVDSFVQWPVVFANDWCGKFEPTLEHLRCKEACEGTAAAREHDAG